MRIALDVMGGDNAPDTIVAGGLRALEMLTNQDRMVLIGDAGVIHDAVEEAGLTGDPRIEIEPTTQVIAMGDPPVAALRDKTDSSIVRMAELGKKRAGGRQCDIIISAGNTGACVAAAQMSMRRLPGVHRPGIAVTLPTFFGPIVICDVGANPDPRPTHLHQYAHMAGVYASSIIGIDHPRVALLSIGAEEAKGNTLVKETSKLARQDRRLNYVGYVEGRDLFAGKADVVVTEGFTGNVVIKMCEGLAAGLFHAIAQEILEQDASLAMRFEPVVKKIYKKHDYHEYGGAPLLGANGICIICHGSSEARTIYNAVRAALKIAELGVNEKIIQTLAENQPLVSAPERVK